MTDTGSVILERVPRTPTIGNTSKSVFFQKSQNSMQGSRLFANVVIECVIFVQLEIRGALCAGARDTQFSAVVRSWR